MDNDLIALAVIGLGAAVVLLLLLLAMIAILWKRREVLIDNLADEIARLRTNKVYAADTARATIKGQLAEQLAPLLPGFRYHPSDFRFLGQPIDFIVYDGLTDAKDGGEPEIREIVLGDIKLGSARLSPHQQAIRRAVEAGRVRWETINIDQQFRLR